MFNNSSKVLLLAAIIFYKTEAFYINPACDYFNLNRCDQAAICGQSQPNPAGSYDPNFMYKRPDYLPTQTPLRFAVPTLENYPNFINQQRAVNEEKLNEESNQHFYQPQTLHFGNNYQQNAHYGPITPDVRLQAVKPAVDYGYYQQYIEPSEYFVASPFLTSPNRQDSSDNKSQPSLGSSKTESSQGTSTITNREPDFGTDSSKTQDLTPNAIKHNVDPEQYKTLLQDEILGTPDLKFSHDEMLSIQHLFPEPNIPLTPQTSQIPPEYFDDPVLRTFYNIDHHTPHAGLVEKHYSPPITTEIKPVLQECFHDPVLRTFYNIDHHPHHTGLVEKPYLPLVITGIKPVLQEHFLPMKNTNNCSNSKPYPTSASNTQPTQLTKNCLDFPFSFQPIFIAVPLFNAPYKVPISNNQPSACGQGQSVYAAPPYDHAETNFSKGSSLSQSRDDKESTFVEDFSNKKSLNIPEVKTETVGQQAEKNSTKPSDSSEEDLFVEEVTDAAITKSSDVKSNENTKNIEGEISTSTIATPQTTVKSFKSLLNAAKTHAERYYDPHAPVTSQGVHKRQIPNIDNVVYPSNWKKQYVKKLEDNNHN